MSMAGDQPFLREVPLPKANGLPQREALRPADILLRAWQGGQDTAVDVTISHSLQLAQRPWTAEKAKAFLAQTEKRKTSKYAKACEAEGWGFIGAAFDAWGGAGPGAKALLYKLLRRAVGGVDPELRAMRRQEHQQHLSLSLMRQVLKLLTGKKNFASQTTRRNENSAVPRCRRSTGQV